MPLIICLVFIKSLKQNDLKVFFLFTITTAILLSIMLYCRFILKDPNTRSLIQRISVANEFIFLSVYIYHNIISTKKKKILIICIPIFLVFCIFDYILFKAQGTKTRFGPLAVESLFFLLVIVYYFYEKMKYIVLNPVYKISSFWISVAFLIYFSGTFLLFLTSIFMFNDKNFVKQYNIIYGSIDIVKNLLLVVALFVHRFVNLDNEFEEIKPNVDLDLFQHFNQNSNLPAPK